MAWVGYDNTDYEIYRYDALTFKTSQITNNTTYDYDPQISDNGNVAWSGYDGEDYEIYLYDALADKVRQLTNNMTYDHTPRISKNGNVVWYGWDDTVFGDKIYLYDAATAKIRPITNNPVTGVESYSLGINAKDDVVWYGSDGTDYEIYIHDGYNPDRDALIMHINTAAGLLVSEQSVLTNKIGILQNDRAIILNDLNGLRNVLKMPRLCSRWSRKTCGIRLMS